MLPSGFHVDVVRHKKNQSSNQVSVDFFCVCVSGGEGVTMQQLELFGPADVVADVGAWISPTGLFRLNNPVFCVPLVRLL